MKGTKWALVLRGRMTDVPESKFHILKPTLRIPDAQKTYTVSLKIMREWQEQTKGQHVFSKWKGGQNHLLLERYFIA